LSRAEVVSIIHDVGIVPAIRVGSADEAHFACEAVAAGGIPIVEITMTVPGAMEVIEHLAKQHAKLIVGAGTVLDVDTAQRCVDAGAQFLTAPGYDCDIISYANKQDVAVLPGALTPTEAVTAWRAGADFVKLFPVAQVGGEAYVKALSRSLPEIALIAAGGVNQQNAAAFILAGAAAIGVGTQLIPTESIERRQAKRIHELAMRFSKFVQEARQRVPPRKEIAAAASHITAARCAPADRP
jgi:2-dehydro-3-deoxyphosphogluconate aldolase/(4S)-4-hydroxy-2-oxoglutarate aldolase